MWFTFLGSASGLTPSVLETLAVVVDSLPADVVVDRVMVERDRDRDRQRQRQRETDRETETD